jgi:hypothetical protein
MRIAIVWFLVLGVMVGSLVACSDNGLVVNMPTSLNELSLSEVWQKTLEVTEVQDSSTNLKALSLYDD